MLNLFIMILIDLIKLSLNTFLFFPHKFLILRAILLKLMKNITLKAVINWPSNFTVSSIKLCYVPSTNAFLEKQSMVSSGKNKIKWNKHVMYLCRFQVSCFKKGLASSRCKPKPLKMISMLSWVSVTKMSGKMNRITKNIQTF